MEMRQRFVCDLVSDIFGPRQGAEEVLLGQDDPRNEYLLGQLHPRNAKVERDPDQEQEGGDSGEEGDEDDPTPDVPVDAGRNFRTIPSSLGLSFTLSRKPQAGDLRICASWARYTKDSEGNWKRKPFIFILSFDSSKKRFEDPTGSIFVEIKTRVLDDGACRVTIYLCSQMPQATQGRVVTDEVIFQPEIRVRHSETLRLMELTDSSFFSSDEDWRRATEQYSHLPVKARGYLCGAYWKEIDPQLGWKDLPEKPPFLWTDGNFFKNSKPEVIEFFESDVRTDFAPMYSAPAPEFDWPNGYSRPTLNTKELSEIFTAQDVDYHLAPLLDGYKKWLESEARKVVTEPPERKALLLSILAAHSEAQRRIQSGLDYLRKSEDARLAFAFMNKAMEKQAVWADPKKAGTGLEWRPFQLAFILLSMESSVERTTDRELCDVIWFPTGGGKTEAYLGLAAFVLGIRRLRATRDQENHPTNTGTGVLSRYTLRLLTIQQFRRAHRLITACESMRLERQGPMCGWRPANCDRKSDWLWGTEPFSIGLWVGGDVTPNKLKQAGNDYLGISAGAINLLSAAPQSHTASPAQIIQCPCCGADLAIPSDGLPSGKRTLFFFCENEPKIPADLTDLSTKKLEVLSATVSRNPSGRVWHLKLEVKISERLDAQDLYRWGQDAIESKLFTRLASFNAVRPGYIPLKAGKGARISSFEIRCPRPECETARCLFSSKIPSDQSNWKWANVHPLFAVSGDNCKSYGFPMRALTVDEMLYANPPSMIVGTGDKFVQAAWNESAASIFGRVKYFNEEGGYAQSGSSRAIPVNPFSHPDLIIQDELHLIDGPLGSQYGIFEIAIDFLAGSPKYVASSATIRNASEQVAAILNREARVFPPTNIDISQGFFLRVQEGHAADERRPGRLFLGLAFPGRAAQFPTKSVWGRLLQTGQDLLVEDPNCKGSLDPYWTLVGYFNAIRELAAGETLWRQDIPQYMDKLVDRGLGRAKRDITAIEAFKNLSSQTDSSALPGILAQMERTLADGDALQGVASTSMFGTGVDVSRLSLMIVHGQPKSASSYIQAVGRIGRSKAGLAVVFLRVSKPRDLNHYEFFTGYHRRLPVAVEPISVKPFAPRAVDKTLGAVLVMLLRNAREIAGTPLPNGIESDTGGGIIGAVDKKVWDAIREIMKTRLEAHPPRLRPTTDEFLRVLNSKIEHWQNFAEKAKAEGLDLKYRDKTFAVMGPLEQAGARFVFPDSPLSLREVEAPIKVRTWRP